MRARFLAILLVFATAIPVLARTEPRDPGEVRQQTFETVWRLVDQRFYDPKFNGVDWKAVHERYAPLVAATKTDDELYPLLNQMLDELHASHFAIVPPEAAVERSGGEDDPTWGGGVGMTLRIVEGRPTITEVEPDGPAARAGLEPGYVVTKIGDKVLADLQSKAESAPGLTKLKRYRVRRAINRPMLGMPGRAIDVVYLDGHDKPHSARLVRTEIKGEPVKFSELPSVIARTTTRRLADGTGYIAFNICVPQLLDDIRAAVQSMQDAPAIIVDLRGNPGGIGLVAPAVASLFVPERSSLGTMRMRKGEIRFITFKQEMTFSKPLVFLVDEATASTSEILAGAMQESGRAVVVGQPSAGAVLPSVIEKLPNGAVFQFAVADFKTPKGVLLEGRGVIPDVAVPLRRADFLAGHDPALDAALAYLASHRRAAA